MRDLLISAISEKLADPALVRRLADECSPAAGRILARLAEGPARGATAEAGRLVAAEAAQTPVEELLARGLLVGIEAEEVELPREVGLALRGDAPAGQLHPDPPALTGRAVAPASVDPAAALAAETVVRQVTTLLEDWGTTPVVPLRTGGLSVRDLRATARLLEVSESEAAFVVELAYSAGLLDASAGVDVHYLPTTAFDRWNVDVPARRWAALVEGWARSVTVASLVGDRDERNRQIAALSVDVRRSGAPATRADVLAALAGAPEGVAPAPADVRALLAWRAPRRGGALQERLIDASLHEAELLGLTGRGAPASTGRLLAELLSPANREGGSLVDPLADTLAPMLPEPVDELLLQADLTAVAPGPLVPSVAAEVARLADIESAGAATVYRFSETSLRRALDAGASPADIHDLLARMSRGPVPQALTYLVDDTARRYGRLRSGPSESYLRCDDPVLLSEVVASRRTQLLGLRRIAPTVVISRLPVAELLDGLRAAGFAPAAEGPDGRVVVSKQEAHRTPARGRGPGDPVAARRSQLRDAVRLLRRGDENARALRLAGAGAGAVAAGSAEVAGVVRSAPLILVRLQNAARERRRVLLGYVDAQGMATDRIVRPSGLEGGYLTAFDEATGSPRQFVLHRVTAVADVADPFALPGTAQNGQ
jgi:hypothetical protein